MLIIKFLLCSNLTICCWCVEVNGKNVKDAVPTSIHQSIYLSIHPSTYLSAFLSVLLFIHPSISPSIGPSIYPSFYLSIHVSIHPCLSIHNLLPTTALSGAEETGWSMPACASLCARLQSPESKAGDSASSSSCAHSYASPAYVVIYGWWLGSSSWACSWSLAAAILALALELALAAVLDWLPCQGPGGNEGDERS